MNASYEALLKNLTAQRSVILKNTPYNEIAEVLKERAVKYQVPRVRGTSIPDCSTLGDVLEELLTDAIGVFLASRLDTKITMNDLETFVTVENEVPVLSFKIKEVA